MIKDTTDIMVINKGAVRFEVPQIICDKIHCSKYDDSDRVRRNSDLINYINDMYPAGSLKLAHVPSDADYYDIDTDSEGREIIYYSIDGSRNKATVYNYQIQ